MRSALNAAHFVIHKRKNALRKELESAQVASVTLHYQDLSIIFTAILWIKVFLDEYMFNQHTTSFIFN